MSGNVSVFISLSVGALGFAVPVALALIWIDSRLRGQKLWIKGEVSWTDLAVALFAALSVLVAVFTYRSVEEYTTISAETFEATNRPYVSIQESLDKDFPMLATFPNSQTICAMFQIKNEGKVPAYDLNVTYDTSIWGDRKAGEFKQSYLGPEGGYHHFKICTADRLAYDNITRILKNHLSVPISIEVAFKADYKGVSKESYHYHLNANYDNGIGRFDVSQEGETVDKGEGAEN